jgi:hypothetical protein
MTRHPVNLDCPAASFLAELISLRPEAREINEMEPK